MSIISFIEEPKTIDRIIRHLKLTFEAERPPPIWITPTHKYNIAEPAPHLLIAPSSFLLMVKPESLFFRADFKACG
jgi:hypothetical protein